MLNRFLSWLLAATLALSPVTAHAVSDVWDYDATTPGNNTNVGGISTAEGMLPGLLNDVIRELISQVKRGVANQGSDITSVGGAPAICATGTSIYVKITGTTTVTSFGTAAAGCLRYVTFTGVLTLTYNATSLILPGGANLTTAAGGAMIAVSEGSGNWRVLVYTAPGSSPALTAAPRGHIAGLTLSNDSGDVTNDIGTAVGEASAADQSALLVLSSALIKRSDASWAVGTNQGCLDGTESVAGTPDTSTWYHIYLIRRPDTGVVDELCSESATSPTMPTNYTQKRRIGVVFNGSGGDIRAFRQIGDVFKQVAVTDRSNTAAAASALLAVSVPTGVVISPILSVLLTGTTSTTCIINLGDAAIGSADTEVARIDIASTDGAEANRVITGVFYTNTSAQIYFSQTNTAGTPVSSVLSTIGWVDRRGQDD